MASPPTYPTTDPLIEGTGTRAHNAVTTQAGDYIVIEVTAESGNMTNMTPSDGTLTWTKQNDVGSATDCRVQQWTSSQDTTGGNRTVTITPSSGTLNYRSELTIVRGSNGPSGKATNLTGQTVSATRNGDNSGMFEAVGDFSAGAVGSPAWTPGGSTIASQQGVGATYIFGRWDDSGAAGTASHGITSPSYTTPSIAVLEMLGTTSPPPAPVQGMPFQVFVQMAANENAKYVASGAAAPLDLAGTATMTTTTSGDLQATMAIGGSATMTTTTAGSLAETMVIGGTAAMTTTTTGNLTQTMIISGSTSMTTTTTGAITATSTLGGSCSMTTTTSGALKQIMVIAGVVTMTTTTTGDFGTLPIAGIIALTTTTSGSLRSTMVIAGAIVLATVTAGNLTIPTAAARRPADVASSIGRATTTADPRGKTSSTGRGSTISDLTRPRR